MKRAALLTTAALIAAPTLAHAELPPGLYANYDLRFSYIDGDTLSEPDLYYSFDGTVQYTFEGTDFGVGKDSFVFGDTEIFNDRVEYYNFYAFYDFASGRILLGETPSAIDLIEMDNRVSWPELFDYQYNLFFTGSFVNYLYAAEERILGVTYQGSYDALNLDVAASYHYSDDADESVYSLALIYNPLSDIRILAGFEAVSDDTVDPRFWLGAGAVFGDFDAEIMYRNGTTNFSSDERIITADVYYHAPNIDDLTIGASILHVDNTFGDNTIYGLGAEYVFRRNFGVAANITGSDGDTVFGLEAFLRY